MERYGSEQTSGFSLEEGLALFQQPLKLPCGAEIPNRIAKASMSERRSDPDGGPTRALVEMYRAWNRGGAGLLITGNFMVDCHHLIHPLNVVCESGRDLDALRSWSSVARAQRDALTPEGARVSPQCWVQLCHPGRQACTPNRIAPSPVALAPGAAPREMTQEEIRDVVRRFIAAARVVRDAGFSGVQIHCAHGYLLSQFLSPAVNQRTDRWGGSLENRARIVLEIVDGTRKVCYSPGPEALSSGAGAGRFSVHSGLCVVAG